MPERPDCDVCIVLARRDRRRSPEVRILLHSSPVFRAEETPMRFMITFNHLQGVWERLSPEEREQHNHWLERFVADLRAEKKAALVFAAPPAQRKTVRKRESGELEVQSGSAVEGPEQLGGYYIIEAESLEEAVEWAKRGRWLVGSNEVIPIFAPGA